MGRPPLIFRLGWRVPRPPVFDTHDLELFSSMYLLHANITVDLGLTHKVSIQLILIFYGTKYIFWDHVSLI